MFKPRMGNLRNPIIGSGSAQYIATDLKTQHPMSRRAAKFLARFNSMVALAFVPNPTKRSLATFRRLFRGKFRDRWNYDTRPMVFRRRTPVAVEAVKPPFLPNGSSAT
jgi:hypothetical protein